MMKSFQKRFASPKIYMYIMATFFSNSTSLGDLGFTTNKFVPVSPSPTYRDSPETSLSYNQPQVEENDQTCVLTIIYELLLNGGVNVSARLRDLEGLIKTEAESNNCYAMCAITLVEAYNINYDVLNDFCRSRYGQRSLNRRMSNQEYIAINQIERVLDRLGFTLDLKPKTKELLTVKEQDSLLNMVKTKCNELISIYEKNEDNENKNIYIELRDKIQRRQDLQKNVDQIQQKIQQNFARMSRRGGKKKIGKHRKTKKRKN